MKTRAILAATAMIAGSFSPVLTIPAWAAVTLVDPIPDPSGPSAETLAAMQTQCDALAAAHDTDNGDIWTAEVVPGDITLISGPTEVGDHTYAEDGVGDQVGAGTFTPAHVEILGDPYRNGGSVNMFGIQQSVGGHYSASAYDFEGEFETTYSYAFSCDILQAVYHPAHTIPGTPPQGYYTNVIENSNGDCQGIGPSNPHWGEDIGGCDWHQTAPGTEDEEVEESWDDAVVVGNEPGTAIEETQTDTLLAHEDAGEGFDTDETLIIGQVVVCISPSKTGTKLPGSWVKQNGYTGDKCTTDWYNGGAKVGVPNLNDGSHNWVTVPIA